MTRTKIIMLVTFVLAMGAGVGVGVLASRTIPQQGRPGPSWLIHELDLTSQQQEQMKQIWMDLVATRGNDFREQMMALQKEREAAIAGLLDAQQSQKYEQINIQFMERFRELWKRAEQEFMAAAEKTRQMLNESQRERYDMLMRRFQAMHNGGEFPGMGMPPGMPPGMGMPGPGMRGMGMPPGRMPTTAGSDI